ncbi:multidrug effflux MFS transporter [Methylovirgula sp. 4M-Z18]|uniref:multidrug effflux MFS transporter n=1 Tax=Methylovirgula sp. 4M-Z18 TaxID=2293567 RepID=UPI000E2ECFC8|nr:multidrug effflux MFS transporter [Methylovirgula sp. 4M-Z18]RFB78044.1 MFS transporter [Methylovirgula sp. 4M-Z18]
MKPKFVGYAVVLGLLSAIGPFAIDMYLPALPAIKATLGADTGTVQMSLMAFFIAIGVCQLIYGPLSDMLGRRMPLYFGLGIFMVGSLGCALAKDIHVLMGFRFLQGIGACAGMVVPRAVVRDLHTGPEAVRLMSLLMLVFSVSPLLAPLTGSFIIAWATWRMIFWMVIVAALGGIVLIAIFLPETRPPSARTESDFKSAFAGYRTLMTDLPFLGITFIAAFGISSFFAYLANSAFVLIEHYGLTPTQYSLCFSLNAAAFFAAAQSNGMLAARFGLRNVVRFATFGYVVPMLLLAGLVLAGVNHILVPMVLLFIGYAFLGLVIPNSVVLALEDHGKIAGTASALMGTLQFLTGAAVMAVTSALGGTLQVMILAIAVCALVSFILAQITLASRRPPHTMAAIESSAE